MLLDQDDNGQQSKAILFMFHMASVDFYYAETSLCAIMEYCVLLLKMDV